MSLSEHDPLGILIGFNKKEHMQCLVCDLSILIIPKAPALAVLEPFLNIHFRAPPYLLNPLSLAFCTHIN